MMLGEMQGVLLGMLAWAGAVQRSRYQGAGCHTGVVHPHGVAGATAMGATSVICALRLRSRCLGKLQIDPDFEQRLFLHPGEGGRLWQIGDKYMTQGSWGKHRQTATLEEQGLGWMEPAFLKALQSRDASSQPWGQETLPASGHCAGFGEGASSPQGP